MEVLCLKDIVFLVVLLNVCFVQLLAVFILRTYLQVLRMSCVVGFVCKKICFFSLSGNPLYLSVHLYVSSSFFNYSIDRLGQFTDLLTLVSVNVLTLFQSDERSEASPT